MTTASPQADAAEVSQLLDDARAAIAEAKHVNGGAHVHELHSRAIGVQMHVWAIERDANDQARDRLPGYVVELRQTLAKLRGAGR